MDNTGSITLTDTGLAPGYDDAPATFGAVGALAGPLPGCGCAASELAAAVRQANALHGGMLRLEATAREAARRHLFATLSLGCVLHGLARLCAGAGVAAKALFAGYKGAEGKRAAALELAGGAGVGFSYATGNRYMKLYKEMARRMEAGMTHEQAERLLADHAACLMHGAYEDPEAALEGMWGPYVTAESVRQAYLELAPRRPAMTIGEAMGAAAGAAAGAGFASWEEQRARLCQQFGGFYASLDTYIERMSMYTTPADREAQAEQLEAAARRLRAMKTQLGLPGLPGAMGKGEMGR